MILRISKVNLKKKEIKIKQKTNYRQKKFIIKDQHLKEKNCQND